LPLFFRIYEAAINERFRRVDLALILEHAGKRLVHPLKYVLVDPFLEAPMTGLIWRIPLQQVFPACAAAQDPQDCVQDGATHHAGTTFAVCTAGRPQDKGTKQCPLM
jgi:hypothetical protein